MKISFKNLYFFKVSGSKQVIFFNLAQSLRGLLIKPQKYRNQGSKIKSKVSLQIEKEIGVNLFKFMTKFFQYSYIQSHGVISIQYSCRLYNQIHYILQELQYNLFDYSAKARKGRKEMVLSDGLKDFICGCASGWTQVFVMQPFQIIKVRLINQSLVNCYYNGIVDCMHKIRIEEGLLAFYKGSLTPLLGIGGQVSLQFVSNGMIKRFLNSFANEDQIPTLGIVFASGLFTGIPSSIVVAPVDRTRILMQLKNRENLKKYKNSLHAGISLYREHGLKGIYLGYNATLLREIIALSVYFSTYDYCMKLLSPQGTDPSKAPIIGSFFAGGLAGASSWFWTYPIDYIKTVMQSQSIQKLKYKSATECAIKQYREEGVRTFFKGFGITMLRSFPVNGAGFLSFQFMMRLTGRQISLDGF